MKLDIESGESNGVLGNGFSTRENDERDLSYYLGFIDGRDEQLDLEAEL